MSLKAYLTILLVDRDALHIYAAVGIQLTVAALFRRSLADWLPWFAVLVAEVVNESFDMWFGEEPHIARWQVVGAAHDFFNTMALPTLLLLLTRYAPSLFAPRKARPARDEDES